MEGKGGFEISEQRLADQARAIKVNGWLSDIEIEQLKREAMMGNADEDEGYEGECGLSNATSEQGTSGNDERQEDPSGRATENMTDQIQGLPSKGPGILKGSWVKRKISTTGSRK